MSNNARDLLFLRHGMNSNRESMQPLCDSLLRVEGSQPRPDIDNESYDWKAPVLAEGIALARQVVKAFQPAIHRRIALIGHSQGGLVCRVAAAVLAGEAAGVMRGRSTFNSYAFGPEMADLLASWTQQDRTSARAASLGLTGVVMLATPNGGAFTLGQLSLAGRTVVGLARRLVSPFGVKDLADLTTDRLPRLLQHYKVPFVRYLSVSGSAINRYSSLNYDDLTNVPLVNRLAVRLELPNDRVVEESSVDLEEAPLPCEIDDMTAQYEHVRAYVDCTEVGHTTVQSNPEVIAIVKDRIQRWQPREIVGVSSPV